MVRFAVAANGCEINLASNAANCGGCGVACAAGITGTNRACVDVEECLTNNGGCGARTRAFKVLSPGTAC